MSSLGPDDLLLCAGTLASTPLAERIEVAAQAGYQGVTLFLEDVARAHAEGHSDADLRARLAHHGLAVGELDPLLTWAPGTAPQPEAKGFLRYGEDDFYRVAEALGARSINAVLFDPRPVPPDQLTEAFAGLCDRAAGHGLLVHLEFMPFSQVNDAEAALAVVEAAARPNAGVMFDVWHHTRSHGSEDALRRAAPHVLAVQLDDASAEPEQNLVDETLHRRLLPGEGAADVARLIAILDEGGCRAPLGVEVFCDELASLPPLELARRCAQASRRVIEAARR